MQRTVQKITQKLIHLLPENDQYYRLDELREWGFPSYIVRRIKVELEHNLAESMIIPKTDWANTQSDAVLDAWQQFVDAIRAEARLPASYGKTVIETAVDDVVRLLVQPRKNVPEVIFGDDERLSRSQLYDRIEKVVVYRHFVKLIRRYMEKRDLDSLGREQCEKIVKQADEKLTRQYSPLNWAQMLDPLFRLMDDNIDTNLLRLFFEDRNMSRIARKFDLMNNDISRAEFIEALSSPDSLSVDEEEHPNLFEDQPKTEYPESEPDPESIENEEKDSDPLDIEDQEQEDQDNGSFSLEQDEPVDENYVQEPEAGEEENFGAFFMEHSEEEVETEEESDDQTLNAIFSREEDREQEIEYAFEEPEESEMEPDAYQEEFDEPESAETEVETEEYAEEEHVEEAPEEEIDEPEGESEGDLEIEETESEGEKSPMWMRYMSDEEIEEYKREQEEAEDELMEDPLADISEEQEESDNEFLEDPIIDLTEDDTTDQEIDLLKDLLRNDRDRFVEEIFGGSERAFEEAMEEIASFSNWREASKYIEQEIFKRNLVDVYSEAAIDFTDQLHNHFNDKQNSN